jgi:hypothetical protein
MDRTRLRSMAVNATDVASELSQIGREKEARGDGHRDERRLFSFWKVLCV